MLQSSSNATAQGAGDPCALQRLRLQALLLLLVPCSAAAVYLLVVLCSFTRQHCLLRLAGMLA
jgi:hypothetical protein